MLVLQADLVVSHGRPRLCIVPDIDDAIPYFLGSTEVPEVVVVFDDLDVVANRLATRWRF